MRHFSRSIRRVRRLVRFLAVVAILLCWQTGLLTARPWRKDIGFRPVSVRLEDQIKLPDALASQPPWLLTGSDKTSAIVNRFDLPSSARINSAKFTLRATVTAFPMMFSAVNPSSAEARLQSSRTIDALFGAESAPSDAYRLGPQGNMDVQYIAPYDNRATFWNVDSSPAITSHVIRGTAGSGGDATFNLDLALRPTIRMSGIWSGRWTGFVNVDEATSLPETRGLLEIDFSDAAVSPSTNGADGSSSADAVGILGGDAVDNHLDFGPVRVGTSVRRTVQLSNVGAPSSVLVGTIGGIEGVPLSSFSVVGSSRFQSILAGSADSREVEFSPTSFLRAETYLAIETGVDDFYTPLAGVGTGPMLRMADGETMIDFGEVDARRSRSVELDLTNDLTSEVDRRNQPIDLTGLTIKGIEVEGSGFEVRHFTPSVLYDGSGYASSSQIEIGFVPAGREGLATGVLRVFTDQGAALGSDGQVFAIPLNAVAVPAPATGSLAVVGVLGLAVCHRRKGGRSRP